MVSLVGWVAVEVWSPGENELRTGLLVVAAIVFGVGVGSMVPAVARRLGLLDPAAEGVREALLGAREAAGAADLREVERGTLAALRRLAGPPPPAAPPAVVARPYLVTFAPLREVFLDGAGEPRARDPVLPPALADVELDLSGADPDAPSPITRVIPRELLDLVRNEPLGVVRTHVLRALEVRRPDLRPALAWCDRHDAIAVVGLMIDGDLEGLLLLPRGRLLEEIGLVHARTLRTVARVVAPRVALETALARAAARTRKAEQRAREVDHLLERGADERRRLHRALGGAVAPLAAQLAIGGYAPSARALRAELDGLAPTNAHLAVVHRPGTDPAAYAARLHLTSGRAGALHVVDASRSDGVDPARWNDPVASPIELARQGTLLVLAAHLLPLEAQRAILRALAFQVGPGGDPSPVDVRVLLAFPSADPSADDLARARAAVDPALFARLHPSPLRLPPLAARAEDLRAIVLDRLASIGLATRGAPLGLADEALAILVEHPWPGDDDELAAVLVVAASRTRGPRLDAADVRAALAAER